MTEAAWRIIENLGATGLFGYFVWKLMDKWAGKFLDAQLQQAKGLSELASAVKEGQTDQHEVLLAVRVQSRQIEEMKTVLEKMAAARA